MSKYSNLWSDGEQIVKSEEQPSAYHYPLFAAYRVHRDLYMPYDKKDGSEAWVKLANKYMASIARGYFERRSR